MEDDWLRKLAMQAEKHIMSLDPKSVGPAARLLQQSILRERKNIAW
jgi:hypothetical protein